MANRSIEEIEHDINKLSNFMETLTAVAGFDGYTVRQRLDHHKKMVALLKEKIIAQGGTLDR